MARAFVAIRPPEPVLDAIGERMAGVELRGGRPTTRAQWHVTVQFLGGDVDLDAVASALRAEPFAIGRGALAFGTPDALGSRRRARILALGLREGLTWARALASDVEARLAPLGYVRDDGDLEFVPHLTLARFRVPIDLRPLYTALGPDPVGPEWNADEIVLYESELLPDGARHTARAQVPLSR